MLYLSPTRPREMSEGGTFKSLFLQGHYASRSSESHSPLPAHRIGGLELGPWLAGTSRERDRWNKVSSPVGNVPSSVQSAGPRGR